MYNEVINTLYSKSDKLNWSAITHEKDELISKEYSTNINGSTLSLLYNKIEKIWLLKYLDFKVNSAEYPLLRNIANKAADTIHQYKVNKDASNLLSNLKVL